MAEKRYKNITHNITAKFIDAKTNQQLFEVTDRNCDDIGEMFASVIANNIVMKTLGNRKLPDDIDIVAKVRLHLE
jgi:hypothetical protein